MDEASKPKEMPGQAPLRVLIMTDHKEMPGQAPLCVLLMTGKEVLKENLIGATFAPLSSNTPENYYLCTINTSVVAYSEAISLESMTL